MCLGNILLGDIEFAHLTQIKRHHQGHLISFRGIRRIGIALLCRIKVFVKEEYLWLRLHDHRLWFFGLLDFDHLFGGFCHPVEISDGIYRDEYHLVLKHM